MQRSDCWIAMPTIAGPGDDNPRPRSPLSVLSELHMRSATGFTCTSLLFACILASTACERAQPETGDTDAPGGSFIAAIQGEPRVLLPPLLSHIDEKMVSDQLFEPLAWLGDDGHIDRDYRPALADEWSWENDSTTIVF